VEKCCSAVEATDDTRARRMRFTCRVTKATEIHSEYVMLFSGNIGYVNAS